MALPRRVWIVGNSGAGKTTLGSAISDAIGGAHLELDSIRHQAAWVELPDEEFCKQVEAFCSGQAWVVDGNYSIVQPFILGRADAVVWLDLPRSLVMRQVVTRTIRRVTRRQELWNGNREPLSNLFRLKPEKSIIAWTWTNHHKYVARYSALMANPAVAHLDFYRLRSHAEGAELVARLRAAPIG